MTEPELREKFIELSAAQLKEFGVEGSPYLVNRFAVLVWKKFLPFTTQYGDQRVKEYADIMRAATEYYEFEDGKRFYSEGFIKEHGDQRELAAYKKVATKMKDEGFTDRCRTQRVTFVATVNEVIEECIAELKAEEMKNHANEN